MCLRIRYLFLYESGIEASKSINVLPVHAAVSDVSGSAMLYVSPGHSNHSLIESYTDYQDVITVPAVSVDDHLGTLGNPVIDFAKLDVEGSEILVLNGMTRTILRSPNLSMVVELDPRALRAGGRSQLDLLNLLKSLGFVVQEIDSWGIDLDPHLNPSDVTRNLLCQRDNN